jgi:CheY-like chemotaxis protein
MHREEPSQQAMPAAAHTILIVEDEPDLAEVVCESLADLDVKVVCAADGEEGLSLLNSSVLPSLILLDFHMPNMDGFEFRAKQLKDARLRDVPVVFMTAIEQIPLQRDQRNGVICLKKPFTPDELVAAVKRVIY